MPKPLPFCHYFVITAILGLIIQACSSSSNQGLPKPVPTPPVSMLLVAGASKDVDEEFLSRLQDNLVSKSYTSEVYLLDDHLLLSILYSPILSINWLDCRTGWEYSSLRPTIENFPSDLVADAEFLTEYYDDPNIFWNNTFRYPSELKKISYSEYFSDKYESILHGIRVTPNDKESVEKNREYCHFFGVTYQF